MQQIHGHHALPVPQKFPQHYKQLSYVVFYDLPVVNESLKFIYIYTIIHYQMYEILGVLFFHQSFI